MQDQVQALLSKGIPAALISSNQTETQNSRVLGRALLPKENEKSYTETQKEPLLTLLYITPESIQTDRMRKLLKQLHESDRLTLFAVDEAHCLSR